MPAVDTPARDPILNREMANDERTKQSLPERIKEGLRQVADEWLETVEGLLRPAPELVPIPVRRPARRYR